MLKQLPSKEKVFWFHHSQHRTNYIIFLTKEPKLLRAQIQCLSLFTSFHNKRVLYSTCAALKFAHNNVWKEKLVFSNVKIIYRIYFPLEWIYLCSILFQTKKGTVIKHCSIVCSSYILVVLKWKYDGFLFIQMSEFWYFSYLRHLFHSNEWILIF